jgi:hypothetical protein
MNMTKFFNGTMNLEIAEFIKELRVDKEFSHRKIHQEFQSEYIKEKDWYFNPEVLKLNPDTSYPHGNQNEGKKLCDTAMKLLGESLEDGWEIDN